MVEIMNSVNLFAITADMRKMAIDEAKRRRIYALADYLGALRSEAIEKFNSHVVKEQTNVGIENKNIRFPDEQIIAKANNISGSFSVKKRTILGFNFHYVVQLPGPVSWKTGCPR